MSTERVNSSTTTVVGSQIVSRAHLQIQSNIESLQEPCKEDYVIHHPVDAKSLVQGKINISSIPVNILPFHCLPYTDLRPEACKFKSRGCLIRTWGLKDASVREKYNSLSWYSSNHPMIFPVPVDRHKNGVELADTKLLLCSNTECTRVNADSVVGPTVFHFCCYANMLKKEGIEDLLYKETDNFFTNHQKEQLALVGNHLQNNEIILPVCGKKCYNVLLRKRQTQIENEKKEREKLAGEKNKDDISSLLRWDSDSKNGSLTSEGVIVDWLTEPDNVEMYFGGTHGPQNAVSGTRKDSFHQLLSQKIFQTNGEHLSHVLIFYFKTYFINNWSFPYCI